MNPSSPVRTPLPGTRPAGARDEQEAARQVREMFSRIAPRYDFLNHLLSLRLDRLWRRRVARRFSHILTRPDARGLDLCCGTGDLTLALRAVGPARVFGTDFAHPMLVRAQEKTRAGSERRRFRRTEPERETEGAPACEGTRTSTPIFLEADALALPFACASFDLVTAAFGFRNLANYERGLYEIYRVLRPGGEVGLLEFAEPRGLFLGPLYRFYFTKVLPPLGGVISGSFSAYSYLPSSVAKFPLPDELAAMMLRAGFADARFERWTGGIVALHIARR